MVDVWLDAATPKDSLLIYSLLPPLQEEGCRILVTAKKQTQTTEILDLLNVDYICVGEYGETLEDKLMVEQKRTLQFVDLFDQGFVAQSLLQYLDNILFPIHFLIQFVELRLQFVQIRRDISRLSNSQPSQPPFV